MADALELLERFYGPADLTASAAVLVSMPEDRSPSFRRVIDKIVLANHSGTTTPVTLYQNGTAPANEILPAVSVDGDAVLTLEGPYIMNPGDTFQGLAGTAARVAVTIYGRNLGA